jgi:hypothetical protein
MLFHRDSHLQLYQMGRTQFLKVMMGFLKTPETYLEGRLETELIPYLGQEDLLEDQTMEATGFPTMELAGHLLHSTGHNHLDLKDLPYLAHNLLTLEDLQYPDLNQIVHQDLQGSGHPQLIPQTELALIHLEVEVEATVSPIVHPIDHLMHLTDLQILVLVIAQAQTLMDLAQ